MASELRVNTLKDASGNNSIATSFVANGRQSESPAWTAMTSSVGATATTTVRITSRNTSNTATDQKQLHTQFMGDLA